MSGRGREGERGREREGEREREGGRRRMREMFKEVKKREVKPKV